MKRCAAAGAGAGVIIGTGAGAGAATTCAGAGAMVTTGAGWSAAPCVAASAATAKLKSIGNLPLLQKHARPPASAGRLQQFVIRENPYSQLRRCSPLTRGCRRSRDTKIIVMQPERPTQCNGSP